MCDYYISRQYLKGPDILKGLTVILFVYHSFYV